MGKLTRKTDFGEANRSRDISGKYGDEFKRACDPWTEPTWAPGEVSRCHYDHGSPDATDEPVKAYSPTAGKYAKKGGSGQRSGD